MIYAEYLADFNVYIVLEGIDKINGLFLEFQGQPIGRL